MTEKHAPGILGYALFRDGKQTGFARWLPVAQQWVDAEIVPLCAASERDDMLEALHLITNEAVRNLGSARIIARAAIAKATRGSE